MQKTASSLISSFLIISLFLASCRGDDAPKAAGPGGPGAAAANEVKDYPVFTIAPRTTTLSTNYPATIQGQQNIEIRPKIDGYVEKIYVDEGATVRKGQLLFRI